MGKKVLELTPRELYDLLGDIHSVTLGFDPNVVISKPLKTIAGVDQPVLVFVFNGHTAVWTLDTNHTLKDVLSFISSKELKLKIRVFFESLM